MKKYAMATIFLASGSVQVAIRGNYSTTPFISDFQKYGKGSISQNGITIFLKLPLRADDANDLIAFVYNWFLTNGWEPYSRSESGATDLRFAYE